MLRQLQPRQPDPIVLALIPSTTNKREKKTPTGTEPDYPPKVRSHTVLAFISTPASFSDDLMMEPCIDRSMGLSPVKSTECGVLEQGQRQDLEAFVSLQFTVPMLLQQSAIVVCSDQRRLPCSSRRHPGFI